MIRINGKEISAAGKTVAECLSDGGFDKTRVAVELNGNIVPKSRYQDTTLADGDSVEIVSFVGGG
ncbi:MAG: sulfur carrier protein ThiS [Clostridiales bacterium]|nr:sulfur carrier protein ThiS [Clostridiales bacterium]